MRKVSILLITGFSLIIIATMLWQWIAFSNNQAKSSKPEENINLAVTVKIEERGLKISQEFSNLGVNRKYSAAIPSQVSEVKCTLSDEKPCEEGNLTFSEVDELQFEYDIEADPGIALLLNDWLVLLKDTNVAKTRIEVVDQINSGGTWTAGLPLKGYKQTEVLQYYVFEGTGANPSLYWQEKPLARHTGQRGIDYYVSSKDKGIYKFDSLKPFAANQHLSVVIHDGNRLVHGNGIIHVGSSLRDKELEQQLAVSFLSSKFESLAATESWIIDALASLVTKHKPLNVKSAEMVKELKSTLTQAELGEFINQISDETSNIELDILDQYLFSIKGMKTKFFSENRQDGSRVFPLLFVENRSVVVNGAQMDQLDVINKGDKKLFPLAQTMGTLGFKTESGPGMQSIEISSEGSRYSFNLKNKIFIHNGKSFGLLENPFHNIQGTLFIERHWLNAIFNVSVIESQDSIALSF